MKSKNSIINLIDGKQKVLHSVWNITHKTEVLYLALAFSHSIQSKFLKTLRCMFGGKMLKVKIDF